MYRERSAPRGLAAAAIILLLAACDDSTRSPVEPAEAALQTAPFEPSLPPGCPENTFERGPEQVLDDLRAAIAAEDYDAALCNYAADAVVIGDGGIDASPDEIRSALRFFNALYGGVQPIVIQDIIVEVADTERRFPPAEVLHQATPTHVVRTLFTIDTPCIAVPDGIDTYVIRSGQVHAQTAHAFPLFTCLP